MTTELVNIHNAKISIGFGEAAEIECIKRQLAEVLLEIGVIKIKLEVLDSLTEGLPTAVNRLSEHISNLEGKNKDFYIESVINNERGWVAIVMRPGTDGNFADVYGETEQAARQAAEALIR